MRFRLPALPPARLILAGALLGLLFAGGAAQAQLDFPRVGISASPDSSVTTITAAIGEPFTLYACVFAHNNGDVLDQPLTELHWVLHQVCCGAVLEIIDVQYNSDFTHSGTVPTGVVSTSETCVDQPSIVLATLTVAMEAPEPGEYLAAAGPGGPTYDCAGETLLMMDMVVTVTATGDITPVEPLQFDALKALYR